MLSACGGGGGGGSTVPATDPSIVIDPTKTLQRDGLAKQVFYTWDAGKDRFSAIGAVEDAQARAIIEFDASDALVALGIETTTATSATTKIRFVGSDIKAMGPDFVEAENTASKAIVSNPRSAAWNYQTFGVWESGLDKSNGYYGAMSVGTSSPSTAIPNADGATFTGKVIGSYVRGGIGEAVLADLTVGLSGQTLTFTTLNTRYTSGAPVPTNLDMTNQTLTYDPATNRFQGAFTAGALTGSSTGQFYGPNAEELGGVFFLRNAGDPLETYSGAYGATRPTP